MSAQDQYAAHNVAVELRDERDRARLIAVELEQEVAQLRTILNGYIDHDQCESWTQDDTGLTGYFHPYNTPTHHQHER